MSDRSTYRLKILDKDFGYFLKALERLCPGRVTKVHLTNSWSHVMEVDLDDDEYLMLKICCHDIEVVPSSEERSKVLEDIKKGLI